MEDLIWVRIETTKGNDDIWCFKGQLLESVFKKIVSNKLASGYFKLDNVYWVSTKYDDYGKEQGETLYQYGKDKLKAYRGDLFLRVEHLVSIAPIDGEMELAKFKKADEKHLSLVTPIRG